MKKTIVFWALGFLIVFLDQIVKMVIQTKCLVCSAGGFLVFSWFKIEIYKNRGIAFGFSIPYFILYLLVILILVFCFLKLRKGLYNKNFLVVISLMLVLGGAISNLIDRFRLGYVVDIFHFVPLGSMFNLADLAIVCGVIMLIWREIFKSKFKIPACRAGRQNSKF